MNKIGSNPTQSPKKNRSAKHNVVTSLTGERKSATRNQVSKALDSPDLRALETTIKQLPDIDAARVVELHNRIMAAEYAIDSDRIAAKLIYLESSIDR